MLSSGRLNSSIFSSPGPSTPSGRKPNTRAPNVARQSAFRTEQILEENELFVLKAKNSPVPVQVQEVLRNVSQISLKLDPSGWAWIVSECMTYLWRYSLCQSTSSCIRLTLPCCNDPDTLWTANLIIVQVARKSCDLVRVIGASSDGRVFLWKGTSEDVPYKEVKINLINDSIIHSICNLELLSGVALLASKGTIYILNNSSQTLLKLEPPQGMLSGISRRFSSFLFGGQSSANREAVRLLSVPVNDGTELVCVLTDSHLQLWKIMSIESGDQQMQYDVDMKMMINDELASENWFNQDNHVMEDNSVWLLDCQVALQGLVILFAATDSHVIKYGLALIPCDPDSVPYSCDQLIDVNYTERYQAGLESNLFTLQLQSCQSHSQAGVYCSKFIIPIQLDQVVNGGEPKPNMKFNKIDLESHNAIIGSGTCQNEVLFFTLKHGILSLHVSAVTDISPQKRAKTHSSSVVKMAVTPSHITPRAPLSTDYLRDAYENETEELKNAFMIYLSNDLAASCALCSRVLPNQSFAAGINTPGDIAVMKLSEMVLNDIPSMDTSLSASGLSESFSGASSSLIIVYQLQDKLEAHTRLIQFLSVVKLLDKLSCLSVRGRIMTTCDLLCEHAEKIMAGIALKKNINRIIEDAIKAVLQERPPLSHLHPGLTAQDVFFSQVALIEDIFGQLIHSQTNALRTLDNPADKLQTVLNTATVIQSMFREAIQYRNSHPGIYHGATSKTIATEYLPWTASCGRTGGRSILTEQLYCLIDVWKECDTDPVSKSNERLFWNQYCGLAQQLFNGYETQLQSLQDKPEFEERFEIINEEYNNDCNNFIGFAFGQHQLAVAVELAETFHHFHTLIQICEQCDNRDQLKIYFNQFKAVGFGDVLFKYYLNNGNLKTLLSFSDCFPKELESFLSSHDSLSWIHYLATRQYDQVGKKLVELSDNEDEILARKKTMLSIAKLSLIAEDKDCGDMKRINNQLKHIEYHENIDESVLNREGLYLETMPPLPPNRLVELYVDQESSDVDQFLCALEYVASVFEDDTDNPDCTELLVYIWSQAILRDHWDEFHTDDALNTLQDTFFMNVLSKGNTEGIDMTSLLPDIDDLLQSRLLTFIIHSNTFLFLIRAAYESIHHDDTEEQSL